MTRTLLRQRGSSMRTPTREVRTPETALRFADALSFSTRNHDSLHTRSSVSSWLTPADEDSFYNSCCENKGLVNAEMETRNQDGERDWEVEETMDSRENVPPDPEFSEVKNGVTFRRVNQKLLLAIASSLEKQLNAYTMLKLKGLDARQLILASHPDCPSYIKMDGYIDEDLKQENVVRTEDSDDHSLSDRLSSTRQLSSLVPPRADFPFYSPQLLRRRDIQDLLPKISTNRVNISNFLAGVTDTKKPRTTEWKQLLATWTDPSNPPSSLKSLLRSGCPPKLRAHAWNLLVIRRTSQQRRCLRYTDGLDWSHSDITRDARAVKQINELTLSTRGRSLDDQLRVRRVLLSLYRCVGFSDLTHVHRIIAALLPVFNNDEEATFWAMIAFHASIFPPGFFVAPDKEGPLLWKLLEMFVPQLVAVLSQNVGEQAARTLVLQTTRTWRSTLLLESFVDELVWRMWDLMLLEGVRVFFRYHVALLVMLQPLLECVTTKEDIVKVLKRAGDLTHDVETISKIANEDLRGITGKLIERLRRRKETSRFVVGN